jgi:hypothetical protein
MSLWIEGDKKKIRDYRDLAERDGLTIKLYSENQGSREGGLKQEAGKGQEETIKCSPELLKMYPTQQEILKMMRKLGQLRAIVMPPELSDLNLKKATYYASLKKLESMGLVRRKVNIPKYVLYELDEKGKKLFE